MISHSFYVHSIKYLNMAYEWFHVLPLHQYLPIYNCQFARRSARPFLSPYNSIGADKEAYCGPEIGNQRV